MVNKIFWKKVIILNKNGKVTDNQRLGHNRSFSKLEDQGLNKGVKNAK